MKKRVLGVVLMLFLIGSVFCGCAREDAPAAGQGLTSEPAAPDAVQSLLVNNRSISGGVKSSLLQIRGMDVIPTARPAVSGEYVRTAKSMVPYDLENDVILTTVYSYNEARQQMTSSTQSGNVFETFSYDEQGRMLHHANKHDLDLYRYSSDGQLESIDHYDTRWDENGTWTGKTVYSYEGPMVRESRYHGEAEELEAYTVYMDGRIVEHRSFGQYTQTWEFYEYDDYGNLKYMFTADEGEKELLYEYRYNEYGALSQIAYYSGGEPDGTSNLYFYNDAGDCICIEIGYVDADTDAWNVSVHFDFTYDEDGNLLTEQASYADGEPLQSYYLEYAYEGRSE